MFMAHDITVHEAPARRRRWLAALLLAPLLTGCGGDDDIVNPPGGGRVWHATPTGAGSECGTAQACLDGAAPGDTVELAAGIYNAVTDTLVEGGPGAPITVCLTARPGVVMRAAPGADVRIDGAFAPGRIGLHKPASVETLVVRGLRFDNCEAGLRAADGTVEAGDCRFVAGRHGLVADGATLAVSDCRFEELAGAGLLLRNCAGTVSGCQFWGNNDGVYAAQSRDLLIERSLVAFVCFTGMRFEEGGRARLTNVTIHGAGMAPEDSTAVVVAGGTLLEVDRCILAGNRGYGLDCRAGGTAEVSCSDLFDASAGAYGGCADVTGQAGNIAVDPRFCSTPDLDFHLRPDSPARAACGAMGAFGLDACGAGPAQAPAGLAARIFDRNTRPTRISPRLIHWAAVSPRPTGSFVR